MKPLLPAILLLIMASGCQTNSGKYNRDANSLKAEVAVWLTDPDAGVLFKKQDVPLVFTGAPGTANVIEVDDTQTFQTIDGFGYTLTGGSAMHLYNMDASSRAGLLKELFATDDNSIGVSYLRI